MSVPRLSPSWVTCTRPEWGLDIQQVPGRLLLVIQPSKWLIESGSVYRLTDRHSADTLRWPLVCAVSFRAGKKKHRHYPGFGLLNDDGFRIYSVEWLVSVKLESFRDAIWYANLKFGRNEETQKSVVNIVRLPAKMWTRGLSNWTQPSVISDAGSRNKNMDQPVWIS